jgi:hypothetical protein
MFPNRRQDIASASGSTQCAVVPANQNNLTPRLQPTWGDWFGCLWSAGSCWFMAGMFVTAWWWPRSLDNGRWVKLGVGVMVLEFILIHSGAFLNHFMGEKAGWERDKKLIGMTAFYSLFGASIALAFHSWWILGSFALVMSGRLWSLFGGQSDMERAVSMRRVAASALLFLGLTFATLFIPLPRGGINGKLLTEVWPTRGGGAWEREPERALAMGAGYFLLLGLVELRPPRKSLPPPTVA